MGHDETSASRAARAALALLAAALFLCALVPQAIAAPTHPRLASLDVTGLNHACGAAVDSEGDVYASSAGESKVYVFDPEHHQPGEQLAEIANASEPCGLAVQTDGTLYVSEQATGNVVRYEPSEYPFEGAPTYGAAEAIDSSGEAAGIAVDPYDDRLYVARGDHIAAYDAEGTLGIDEMQRVRLNASTTGGTFTLSFDGQTTAAIPYNASAAEMQGALEALANVAPGDITVGGGPGDVGSFTLDFEGAYAATDVPQIEATSSLLPNEIQSVTVDATAGTYALIFRSPLTFKRQTTDPIAYDAPASKGEGAGSVEAALEGLDEIEAGDISVSGGPGGPGGTNPYLITFEGTYAGNDIPQMFADQSDLTGVAATATTTRGARVFSSTPTPGWSGQIGEGEPSEATGVAGHTSAGGARYVYAADAASDEIEVFSGPDIRQLELRRTIAGVDNDRDPETPDQPFGLGAAGTSLAADRASGHFFLYDAANEAVDEFDAAGWFLTQVPSPEPPSSPFADAEPTGIAVFPQRCEVQRLTMGAKGGEFTLSFEGEATSPIAVDSATSRPMPAEVREALEGLAGIEPGEVAVSGLPPGALSGFYSIAFAAGLCNRDVEQIVLDGSELTGGSASLATEVQGLGPGRLYVTAGAGAGAEALAFEPLVPPSRRELPEPSSFALETAGSVAVDRFGNRYVAAGASIGVYPPESSEPLTTIERFENVYDVAVDSECNVYALDENPDIGFEKEAVEYVVPDSCPPGPGAGYSASTTVLTGEDFDEDRRLLGIGLDPATDRLYVTQQSSGQVVVLESVEGGSGVHDPNWGQKRFGGREVGVCGATGDVYVGDVPDGITVVNGAGTEALARITGTGSPKGELPPGGLGTAFAVDQSNCHAVAFNNSRGVAEEYEASGAFVAEFGSFTTGFPVTGYAVAIDNSGGPANGTAYVAFDNTEGEINPFDLVAFGPLAYGEAPAAVTGAASEVGGGDATLNGTVDPRGFELEDCRFQHLTEAAFQANLEAEEPPFAGAGEEPCVPGPAEVGEGTGPVAVRVGLEGLDPQGRYRFRLAATNRFGESQGEAGTLGPPVAVTEPARPVAYREATLRATVDPSGLPGAYRFEYGTTEDYGRLTAEVRLAPSAGEAQVEVPIFGLAEGQTYHFRVLVENEVTPLAGADLSFRTRRRAAEAECPNEQYRTGHSAGLPDCRAYELVTPAATAGLTPLAGIGSPNQFNSWSTVPDGEAAGERLGYFTNGTLPGFDGNGLFDGYTASRAPGDHPSEGWRSELFGPSYAEAAPDFSGGNSQEGVAADQRYSFWKLNPLEGSLAPGTYLRTPAGFEPLGRGSLGTDPEAVSHYISRGGAHVIFGSDAHLEQAAPSQGTEAVYDRAAGEAGAEVISVDSEGEPFAEDASYLGATEDGSAVVFAVGGALYLRRGGETVQVAAAPSTFAGVSEDGSRVFYADAEISGQVPPAADLWMCDASAGPCAGPEAHPPAQIAANSRFALVSEDGSAAYLVSTGVLDDAEEGAEGEDSLYRWDAATETTRFIAALDPLDLIAGGFLGSGDNLVRWTDAIGSEWGRALSPLRSTPDGSVLLFQSHAQLTTDNNTEASAAACGDPEAAGEPCIEIYRYEGAAGPGERLTCVSCDPIGAPPRGDSLLQDTRIDAAVRPPTLIPNLTSDGGAAFFQSESPLLPGDANDVHDVYEWKAPGAGGCEETGGCLALVSSGQGEADSDLFGMTRDGSDVFFATHEKLHSADIAGSPSIYDARADGGIPEPVSEAPCEGDSCQGEGSTSPALPSPASAGVSGEGSAAPAPKPSRCAKAARAAKRQSARARRLRRAARRTEGRKARGMRRRAARRARKAKRLARRARRCRARQRRASR